MTPHEAQLPPADDRLWTLTAAFCDGAITPEELAQLETLLRASDDARLFYAAYMDLHGRLQWRFRGGPQGGADKAERAAEGEEARLADDQPSAVVPIILDLSPPQHSPLFTLRSTVGGFLFSYAVSALMLGIALLAGWTWTISRDQQIAQEERGTSHKPGSPPFLPEPQSVGRITGAVDCVWAKWSVASGQWSAVGESEIHNSQSQIPNQELLVRLGAKYNLTSGFMEITYESGAKIILQGPCTFEVESETGGFLTFGKLTARVAGRAKGGGRRAEREVGSGQWAVGSESEIRNPKSEIFLPPSAFRPPPSDRGSKGERTANLARSQEEREPTNSLAPRPSPRKSEIRNPKSEIANPQSPIPSPLFVVRTPTAIVTDLGTEFGVDVDRSGASRALVFQGRVELRPIDGGNFPSPAGGGAGSAGGAIQLGANESARVERVKGRTTVVVQEQGQRIAFARSLPTAAALGQPATSPPAPHYRLTDLGTLGGATSRAYDINAAGQVAGSADLAGGVTHAFLYNNGKMEDLDPASANRSDAFRINSSGKVVGAAQSTDQRLCAFLYSDGKLTYLQRANAMASAACGINSKAIIVGVVTDAQGAAHAFRSDGVQAMTFLTAEFRSWVTDISDRDQAVGYLAAGDGAMRAFVCDGRVMKKLDNLGGGSSYANRINRLGQVAGCCDVSGGNAHAVLWDAAGVHDLGTLGGGNSRAEGINSEGHVVGGAHDASGDVHAFLYAGGVMSDLNALIPPASGWTLRIAMAINDSGQIVGNGIAPDGNTRAFLLTPSAVVARSPDRAAEGRGDLRSQPWHGQETVPQRVAPEGERRGQPMN